jgi:hypothetical protein
MEEDFTVEVRNLLRRCVLSILHQLEQRSGESSSLENAQFRLEWLLGIVIRYHHSNIIQRAVVDLLSEALSIITNSCETQHDAAAGRLFSGSPGRPKFNISHEQLEFLLERRFTTVQMSRLLGVSVRTIERRMAEFGLSVRGTYTIISDERLDTTTLEILTSFPNIGYKRMTGHLRSRGMRIQQKKIRESMRRVDPQGTLIRALEMNIIHRRAYSVPSPLALWHIDGNHKLIRYVPTVQGCI